MAKKNTSRKSRYDLRKQIGKGTFGRVFRAFDKEEKIEVAIKIVSIDKKNMKEIKGALNEVRILASLNSKYIVNYQEAFVNPSQTQLWIVMEYMPGGDLAHMISLNKKKKTKLLEDDIWKYFLQILKGIRDLNTKNIIHRDIKPANIFLSKDLKILKIGDMNVSKVLKNENLTDTAIGTPYYLAPEIWNRELYDEKCDVFSLGCLIFELASLKHPFEANSSHELHSKVQNVITPNIPWDYSSELNTIVKKCMTKNPLDRPSAEELLQNAFVLEKNEKFILENAIEESFFKNRDAYLLLDTIRIPKNMISLNDKLPTKKKIKARSARFIKKDTELDVSFINFVDFDETVTDFDFNFKTPKINQNGDFRNKSKPKINMKKNKLPPKHIKKTSTKKNDLPIKKRKRSKSTAKDNKKQKFFGKSSMEKNRLKKNKAKTNLMKATNRSKISIKKKISLSNKKKTKKKLPPMKKSLKNKSKTSLKSKTKKRVISKSKLSNKSRSISKKSKLSNRSVSKSKKQKSKIKQRSKSKKKKTKTSLRSKSKKTKTKTSLRSKSKKSNRSIKSKKSYISNKSKSRKSYISNKSKSKNVKKSYISAKYKKNPPSPNLKEKKSKTAKLISKKALKYKEYMKLIFLKNSIDPKRPKSRNSRKKTRVRSEVINKSKLI